MAITITCEWQNNRQGWAGIIKNESGDVIFMTGVTFVLTEEAAKREYYGWKSIYMPSEEAMVAYTQQLILDLQKQEIKNDVALKP